MQRKNSENKTIAAKTILIVEDNPEFAFHLRETLKDEGHQVKLEHKGKDGIHAALSSIPDYIIIDIGLSDMDGYSVAKELRNTEKLENTVLIALSGYNPDITRSKELFDHYFIKDTHIDKLLELINAPLSS
ncbi:MAG: response regulator [Spirochaetia bacterium]|nr:response regulator [Spirochaetia bacterium]